MTQKFCYALLIVIALSASSTSGEFQPAKTATPQETAKSGEDKIDEAKLQGSWKVTEARSDGKKNERAIGVEYTFSKGTLLIRRPNRKEPQKHKYEFDAKQNPPHLDGVLEILGMERRTKGIVRLQDGKLTWCWSGSMYPRPTTYNSKAKGHSVYVLERVKKKNLAEDS